MKKKKFSMIIVTIKMPPKKSYAHGTQTITFDCYCINRLFCIENAWRLQAPTICFW